MIEQHRRIIEKLTDRQVVEQLYFTQLLMLIVSFLLGIFMFDQWTDFTALWQIHDMRILTYGIGGALLVIIVDSIVMKVFPAHMYDDGGLNEKMFKNRSIPHIVWLTLLIAFSEEILFRGIVQQQFGLEIASIVFALLHFRYLSKILLFILVVSISIFLGLLYEWTGNLFVPVMTHFVIDLVFACQIRLKYKGRDEHGRNVENAEKEGAAHKQP
ncbi:CPBP family intramembrane glutamic endopeptidase [Bacillus pumilus]|uniref:CPBP family intramembrane glutamic endopeptidase n=1 Tax=Bacillus pumilus TaxID=1408 RepID=UPI00119FD29C|nr:CPBP family intramembrane glutamic endopeptidase [Bacillus pumilus]